MNKKKNTFKATVFKPPKAKITRVKSITNVPFKAPTDIIVQDDVETIISRDVEAMKQQKDELALLEAELEKPFADRNKTLMRKYGYIDGINKIDAYPELSPDQKYNIKVYIPEDSSINRSLRPNPWYTKIEFKYEGDEYVFRFPIARNNVSEDETVYQLDGFPVWIDSKGVVMNDLSEYTLFQALYDYAHNINAYEDLMIEIFLDYGIATQKDITSPLDFRIRGYGFGVTFTKIKHPLTVNHQADVKPPVESTDVITHFSNYSLVERGYDVIGGSIALADKIVDSFTPSHYYFLGLPDDVEIDTERLALTRVISGKSFNPNTFYCLLTGYKKSKSDSYYYFTIINGVLSLSNTINGLSKTRGAVEEFIKQTNRKVYKHGQNDKSSLPDVLL